MSSALVHQAFNLERLQLELRHSHITGVTPNLRCCFDALGTIVGEFWPVLSLSKSCLEWPPLIVTLVTMDEMDSHARAARDSAETR